MAIDPLHCKKNYCRAKSIEIFLFPCWNTSSIEIKKGFLRSGWDDNLHCLHRKNKFYAYDDELSIFFYGKMAVFIRVGILSKNTKAQFGIFLFLLLSPF
jgi:hypothetical protein